MDRKTIFQLVAFTAASYIATALIAWALITAIKYVKEHQAMCICPTTEQPQAPAKQDSFIADLMGKLAEATTYLEFHHPAVAAQIKAMGIDVPAFDFAAPVLVDLRKALNQAPQILGVSL